MIVYTYWKYTILFSMYAMFYCILYLLDVNVNQTRKIFEKFAMMEKNQPREIKKSLVFSEIQFFARQRTMEIIKINVY